jgi:hypothetical protein
MKVKLNYAPWTVSWREVGLTFCSTACTAEQRHFITISRLVQNKNLLYWSSLSASISVSLAQQLNTGNSRLILKVSISHTTGGRTPLDGRSAHRRDLYLTTHSAHNRQTSMHPAGLETRIPTSDWPQTLALDRSATGMNLVDFVIHNIALLKTR